MTREPRLPTWEHCLCTHCREARAEVERLTAENARLECCICEDQRAEIERLRAALSIGIEALEWYEQQQVSEFDLGQKASLILKTALEPKP